MSSTGIRMLFTTGRPLTREGSISTKGQLEQLIGSMQNLQNPKTHSPPVSLAVRFGEHFQR
jgi:hypothetical protein